MIIISIGCAWIAGIILSSIFSPSPWLILTGLIPLPFLPFFRQRRKPIILAGLCLTALFSGALYSEASLPANDPANLISYNDTGEITWKGMVCRPPEEKTNSVQLQVTASSLQTGDTWQEISGTVLIFVPMYPDYEYGDVLLITGTPATPPQLDDFDYEAYLATKGIYSTLSFPKIEVLEKDKGSKPLQWIYSFRSNLSDNIEKSVPEPQASFSRSIILGMKSGLHDEVKEQFYRSGTAHLLAISGLHLTIIAGFFIALGRRFFGRRGYVYVWLALLVVWIYAILTGLNPPVVRAAIMISVLLASELFGRQNSACIALVLTAAIMTAVSPYIVRDAAFQMSFAAMAGLLFIFPTLQRLFRGVIRNTLGEEGLIVAVATTVTDSLSVSTGAVIFVWPLIAYYFGNITPISPIATVVALPFLPLVIVSGTLTGIMGMVFLPVALVIGGINWLFSSCILQTVEICSLIPQIDVSGFPLFAVIIYYVILAFILIRLQRKPAADEPEQVYPGIMTVLRKEWIISALCLMAGISVLAACSLPGQNLRTVFFDVGQGDSILIQKGNRQILIDGGPDGKAVTCPLGRYMPFWDRTIDLVILTHPDSDHLTGLIEVLNRYETEMVLFPDVDSDSKLFRQFRELIKKKAIPYAIATAGQRIVFNDGIFLDVINPEKGIASHEIDDDSIVLTMHAGEDVTFLFTGDISSDTERRLLTDRAVSNCTVLKVAHHGSSGSTSGIFLDVVRPAVAVISAGSDNRFGHPSNDTLERLDTVENVQIYRTDTQGTIEIITEGTTLRVKIGK